MNELNIQDADQVGFSYTAYENAKFFTTESNLLVYYEMKYTLNKKPSNPTDLITVAEKRMFISF